MVAGGHAASRLGLSSVSSRSSTSPFTLVTRGGRRESPGGRAPGGADAVNERARSIRCRNEAEVSVHSASLRASPPCSPLVPPALPPWLNGSLLSLLLAMLHVEKRTGRWGPATDATDDMEELFLVRADRKPGGGDARGPGAWVSAAWSAGSLGWSLGLSAMESGVAAS